MTADETLCELRDCLSTVRLGTVTTGLDIGICRDYQFWEGGGMGVNQDQTIAFRGEAALLSHLAL